ncbi:MAG TPA: hypothetical protein VLF20_01135 [Patescibacteria group bacterium]|nr:hypothetical protein [Patescibacteria group bacterium]
MASHSSSSGSSDGNKVPFADAFGFGVNVSLTLLLEQDGVKLDAGTGVSV